jgi:biopolymer transport protein ExbD
MRFRTRDRGASDIPIAPLVDIMFNLILFLTVTTTFATSGGIDVSLPQASSQRPLEPADKIYVIIDKEGRAYIEGERFRDQELLDRFQEAATKKPDTLIIIQADRGAYHGRVVAIMDLAQSAGLSRLAIAVEQRAGLDRGTDFPDNPAKPETPKPTGPPDQTDKPEPLTPPGSGTEPLKTPSPPSPGQTP